MKRWHDMLNGLLVTVYFLLCDKHEVHIFKTTKTICVGNQHKGIVQDFPSQAQLFHPWLTPSGRQKHCLGHGLGQLRCKGGICLWLSFFLLCVRQKYRILTQTGSPSCISSSFPHFNSLWNILIKLFFDIFKKYPVHFITLTTHFSPSQAYHPSFNIFS